MQLFFYKDTVMVTDRSVIRVSSTRPEAHIDGKARILVDTIWDGAHGTALMGQLQQAIKTLEGPQGDEAYIEVLFGPIEGGG